MSKRFYLKVKQGSEKYLNPWKISNIVEDLAGEYYKKYLLNNVTEKIQDLSESQIPIIFDSSFDLYQKYSKLKDYSLTNNEDIENLYYLGNIIPMEPNIKIQKLNIIFKIHRSLYKELKRNEILMDRSNIWKYLRPNFNNKEELNLTNLNKYLDEILLNRRKDKLESVRARCEKIIQKEVKELENFKNNNFEFELINSIKGEKELAKYLEDNNKRNFYTKHYGAFFSTYKRYKRPIVGIIDIETGNVEIIAKDFIKEDLQNNNENKLEVVDLSKNSPTGMIFLMGYIAVSFLSIVFISGLDDKKAKELEREDIEPQNNDELKKLDDAINKLKEIQVTDNFQDNVVKIDDYKKTRGLKNINSGIKKNIKETFERNEFLNSNVEITPSELHEENDEE